MENLFIDALPTDRVMELEEIKANKQFALKLINDLDKVFQTNYEITDEQESVIIRMKRGSNLNWYNCFSFVVSKSGIKFHSKNLGYYSGSSFKNLGELYQKYKDTGTTADDNFLREGTSRHGFVQFVIPIRRDLDKLKEALRDIVYLMEQNEYKKRF